MQAKVEQFTRRVIEEFTAMQGRGMTAPRMQSLARELGLTDQEFKVGLAQLENWGMTRARVGGKWQDYWGPK